MPFAANPNLCRPKVESPVTSQDHHATSSEFGPYKRPLGVLFFRLSISKQNVALILTLCCSKPEPAKVAKPLTSGVELGNFDKTVRPQDDFYHYVLGSWLKTAQIPADRAEYGAFDKLADDSEMRLRTIVEEAAGKAQKTAGSDERGSLCQFHGREKAR